LSGGAGFAQTDLRPDPAPGSRPGDRQAQPGGEGQGGPPLSPERFRARLASLLEQLDGSAAKLRGAIETLDGGGSVEDVIEQLGGPIRARRLAELWGLWGGPGESPTPDRPVGEGGWPEGSGHGPWETADVGAEEILAFMREHAPELGQRLGQLREEDPQMAERFLLRFSPRVSEIVAARAHDPELAELLTRDFRLNMRLLDVGNRYARTLAAGEAEQADQAKTELRELAAALVDLRHERRMHEIAMLDKRLEDLRAEVAEQRASREQLIGEMVEQAGRGRFRGGPGERGGDRRGPPEGAGRRDRRGPPPADR
jgi:hypothetical protein